MAGKLTKINTSNVKPGTVAATFLAKGNSAGQLIGGLLTSKMTNTSLNKLNTLNGKLPGNTLVGSTGANKSATNRAMGMQSKGGQQAQQAASGNVGVVSQGMVNAEIQNDDVLDPTKLMGL